MREARGRRLIAAALEALRASSSAAPVKAQLDAIREAVELRVVNVDVVTTDNEDSRSLASSRPEPSRERLNTSAW